MTKIDMRALCAQQPTFLSRAYLASAPLAKCSNGLSQGLALAWLWIIASLIPTLCSAQSILVHISSKESCLELAKSTDCRIEWGTHNSPFRVAESCQVTCPSKESCARSAPPLPERCSWQWVGMRSAGRITIDLEGPKSFQCRAICQPKVDPSQLTQEASQSQSKYDVLLGKEKSSILNQGSGSASSGSSTRPKRNADGSTPTTGAR